MTDKIPVSNIGVAHFPPSRILGNKEVCKCLKDELDKEDNLIFLVGHWGAGKTHFGYRIHYEISAPDGEVGLRDTIKNKSAKQTMALYTSLGMIRNAELPLSFDNVLRTGLISLSEMAWSSKTHTESFKIADELIKTTHSHIPGLEEHIESLPIGELEETEKPIEILTEISKQFGVKSFVFIIDEIEEIHQGTHFSKPEMDEFLRETKHRKPKKENYTISFILLTSEGEWQQFRSSLVEGGPHERRHLVHFLEMPGVNGWKDFIAQRNVSDELRANEDVLSALWTITGHNYGWFEVAIYLVEKILKNKSNQTLSVAETVEQTIIGAAKQGRDFLNQLNYQRLIAGLDESQTRIINTLFFSGRPWKSSDLASEVGLSQTDLLESIDSLNDRKGGKIEPIQKLSTIGLEIEEPSIIKNSEFHEELNRLGQCVFLKKEKGFTDLISTPYYYDGKYLVPNNHLDFGARLRWIGAGNFDVMDTDSEKIHKSLLQLKTAEEYLRISWVQQADLVTAVEVEIPATYLSKEKSQDLDNYFMNTPGAKQRAILRGFSDIVKYSTEFRIYEDTILKISTTPLRTVNFTNKPLLITLPHYGNLTIKAYLGITEYEPTNIEKLKPLDEKDAILILLTPSEKTAKQLPNWIMPLSYTDFTFLATLGMFKQIPVRFQLSSTEEDSLWDLSETTGQDVKSKIIERKNRVRDMLRIEANIFDFVMQQVKNSQFVIPLVPKKTADRNPWNEERSPASITSKVFSKKVSVHLKKTKFATEIDDDLTGSWNTYSDLVEMMAGPIVSIASPITSTKSAKSSSFDIEIVDSSKAILEFVSKLHPIGTISEAVGKMTGKIMVATASREGEAIPTANDVLETHIRFLVSTGHLIERKENELECYYKKEKDLSAEILSCLTDIVDDVEKSEKDVRTASFLNYLRVDSKTYLKPWIVALTAIMNRIPTEDVDGAWMLEARAMLPRFAALLGCDDFSETYEKLLNPLKIKHDIDLASEDITLYSKTHSVTANVDQPFSLLAAIIGNLAKEIKTKSKANTPTLKSLISAAKTQLKIGGKRVENLRDNMKGLIEALETEGFDKTSVIVQSLEDQLKNIDTIESKMSGGDIAGFFQDMQDMESEYEKTVGKWKTAAEILSCLKPRGV